MSKRSRHDTAPNPNKPIVLIDPPSPRDIAIFNLLNPHTGQRFLDTRHIHAFLQRKGFPKANWNEVVQRLGYLKEDQNRWVKWSNSPLNSRLGLNRTGVYELSSKAAKAIGITVPKFRPQDHSHDFIECLVDASIQIGAIDHKLDYQTNDPLNIKFPEFSIKPDGRPFVLATATQTAFFPGKEIDRGTENLTSPRLEATKVGEKIAHYAEFMRSRRYKELGFDSALIPFITISESRMRSIMDIVRNTIGKCPWLLFAHTKDWANEPHFPLPTGDFLTTPYERVGFPPFSLQTLS